MIEVTRCVLVAAGGVKTEKTRPIVAAQVPVLRGAHSQCEPNGHDGLPEGQNDEKMTMEALCAPSVVAKELESLV